MPFKKLGGGVAEVLGMICVLEGVGVGTASKIESRIIIIIIIIIIIMITIIIIPYYKKRNSDYGAECFL